MDGGSSAIQLLPETGRSDLDRIAPRQRPLEPAVGTQSWRRLLFLHWIVPMEVLKPLVPAPLELDLFRGCAYVGLVPFQMLNVRMKGWPWRVTGDFGETNVRTYVSYRGRPGVYFFSLDAGSMRAVLGARVGWQLPYFWSKMRETRDGERIRYSVRRRYSEARLDVAYRVLPSGEMVNEEARELADFLLERYLLFVVQGQKVIEGQVHHVPYPVQPVDVLYLNDTLLSSAGIDVGRRPPVVAHWSPGVDVELFRLKVRT